MRKVALFIVLSFLIFASGLEDFPSLVLKDTNGDGVADSSPFCLKFDPSDRQALLLAAELAYRIGFEAGEFVDLLKERERSIWIKRDPALEKDVARITLSNGSIKVEFSSQEGRLAALQFFWRFPYVWKLPPGDAPTWKQVVKEIKKELGAEEADLVQLLIRAPADKKQNTYVEKGQVLEALFSIKAASAWKEKLARLRDQRRRGEKVEVLNYAFIAQLCFSDGSETLCLPRLGAPPQFYRPSYGVFLPAKIKRKAPSALQILSSPVALLVGKPFRAELVHLAFRIGMEQQEARFPLIFTSSKDIPKGRTLISVGETDLLAKHRAKGNYLGLCFEKGEEAWFLKPSCLKTFATSYLFPALHPLSNLYLARFYINMLQEWLPAEAQKALAEGEKEAWISGQIYGRRKVFDLTLREKDEVERVLALLKNIKADRIEVYVSESPERRRLLERKLSSRAASVKVRSSYKCGFFWLLEEVAPALKGKGADELKIYFKEAASEGKQIRQVQMRWLAELYPVDELLAEKLGLPLERITFESFQGPDLYKVEAFSNGEKIAEFALNPPVVKEQGLERISSWVKAWRGGRLIINQRIKSDAELAWDFYRQVVLPKIEKFIEEKTDGKPVWDRQPFFSFLRLELRAPEPDSPLGLDQEIVSPLEALHDELYFYTLYHMAKLLKPSKEGGSLRRHLFPGAILPFMKKAERGVYFAAQLYDFRKPGIYRKNKLIKAFYPSKKPSCIIAGWEPDRLAVRCSFKKEQDFLLYSKAFEKTRRIEFPFPKLLLVLSYEKYSRRLALSGHMKELPEKRAALRWNHPLSPSQAYSIARRIPYSWAVGRSFLGRTMWVVEKVAATSPRYSPAKFRLVRPSVVFNSRQHANEVSSTSYLLKFLLEDSSYLKKINLAANPVENPDGAAIALEMMRKESALHSLHAGRYNALGAEIGYWLSKFSPYAPEGYARKVLLQRWKPDMLLNLHGYPSHEWVQQFTGYIPFPYWDYWIPRGTFFYFTSSESPINPSFSEESLRLLRFLASRLSSNPAYQEFNRRFIQRYRRWGQRWNPHSFKLELYSGVNIYFRRSRSIKLIAGPDETLSVQVPELMDETATGSYLLKLMELGRAYLRANLDYLLTKKTDIVSIAKESSFEISLKRIRKRW